MLRGRGSSCVRGPDHGRTLMRVPTCFTLSSGTAARAVLTSRRPPTVRRICMTLQHTGKRGRGCWQHDVRLSAQERVQTPRKEGAAWGPRRARGRRGRRPAAAAGAAAPISGYSSQAASAVAGAAQTSFSATYVVPGQHDSLLGAALLAGDHLYATWSTRLCDTFNTTTTTMR